MARRLVEATNACRTRRTRGDAGRRRFVVLADFFAVVPVDFCAAAVVDFFAEGAGGFFALESVVFFVVVEDVFDAAESACARMRSGVTHRRTTKAAKKIRSDKLRNESLPSA